MMLAIRNNLLKYFPKHQLAKRALFCWWSALLCSQVIFRYLAEF